MAGLTVYEAVCRPFVPLLALVALSITLSLPHLVVFEFGHRERLVHELAQANLRLASLLATLWLAPRVFARDREDGTLATLLARPIEPATIVLGRFLGALAVMVALLLVLSVAEAAVLEGSVSLGGALAGAIALTAVLLAMAVVLTTALPAGVAAVGTVVVFALGHVHGYLEAGLGGAAARWLLRLGLPDLEAIGWVRDGGSVRALVRAALTAFGYLALSLALAERQQVPATGDRPCA